MEEIISPDDEQQSLCDAEITVRNIKSREKVQDQLQLIFVPNFNEVDNSSMHIKEEIVEIENIHKCNNKAVVANNCNADIRMTKFNNSKINVKHEIKCEQVDVDEEQLATTNEEAVDDTYIITCKEQNINHKEYQTEIVKIEVFAKNENVPDENEVVKTSKKGRGKRINNPTKLRNVAGVAGSTGPARTATRIKRKRTKKLYICDVCDKAYHSKSAFIRHISLKHPELNCNSGTFNCSFCSYKTSQNNHLSRHINAKHTKSISFNCPYCSYKSYYKSHLSVHINAKHSKNISFSCAYCSYTTHYKSHLNVHVNGKHSKNISFNCSYCSFITYRKSNLSAHINSIHVKKCKF